MFKAYVGHSNDPDTQEATADVLRQCQNDLGGQLPQAGVLFAAFDFDHVYILDKIQDAFPGIELVGSTANGEMSSLLGFQEDSLTLLLFCSDQIEIRAGLGRGASKNAAMAVQSAIDDATAKLSGSTQLCLTFPESLNVNGISILTALKERLGEQIPVLGAVAADNYKFEQTYQFFNAEVTSDAVPVLLFSGELLYSHGVASGWQPIGNRSQITKVQNNVVYEIDGKRALDFYEHYLGKDGLIAEYSIHALAVFEADSDSFYLRAPVGFDRQAGTLTFFSDIPVGATIQITSAARDEILSASATSFQQALESYPGQMPAAAILVSCAARRRLLGTQAKAEYEKIQAYLPANLPCCGIYSFGEISPINRSGETQFHNQTFVTLLLGAA